jgi:excisionase family DNA binding protein
MATAAKLGIVQSGQTVRLEPSDLLTPEELAARLKVSKSWVFEQTRQRAKVRNKMPLPCIRLGKHLRFSWAQVCEWMAQNNN